MYKLIKKIGKYDILCCTANDIFQSYEIHYIYNTNTYSLFPIKESRGENDKDIKKKRTTDWQRDIIHDINKP